MKRLQILLRKYWKILVLLLALIIAWVLYSKTSAFQFRDVTISSVGSENLINISSESILENISGLSSTRYFELDGNSISNAILNTSPFVDSVFLFKEFPNRLSILISEKIPFVSLEIEEKRCVLMDRSAYVLRIDESKCAQQVKDFKTILVTSDTPKVEFNVGTVSNYNQLYLISDTIKVLNELEIPVIRVVIDENIASFQTLNGKYYLISFNQDLNTQLARLISVVSELEKKGYKFKSIDLRFKRPVLTVK